MVAVADEENSSCFNINRQINAWKWINDGKNNEEMTLKTYFTQKNCFIFMLKGRWSTDISVTFTLCSRFLIKVMDVWLNSEDLYCEEFCLWSLEKFFGHFYKILRLSKNYWGIS